MQHNFSLFSNQQYFMNMFYMIQPTVGIYSEFHVYLCQLINTEPLYVITLFMALLITLETMV